MTMEILKVQDLCKTYGKGEAKVEALKKVSFSLDKGEFAAVVGESGSGKSTLLNCIGALDTPTSVSYTHLDVYKRQLLGGAKLPKMDVLKEEGRKLTAKKKQLYGEYQKARRDMQELVTIKANIDTLMGYTEPGRKQEKAR